ncbi:hypothetical protein HOY82DRAFT_544763 [Tuber indicum]|nr:hypothetical protein HOY82DRAFT_544763 [Tuber indicum]
MLLRSVAPFSIFLGSTGTSTVGFLPVRPPRLTSVSLCRHGTKETMAITILYFLACNNTGYLGWSSRFLQHLSTSITRQEVWYKYPKAQGLRKKYTAKKPVHIWAPIPYRIYPLCFLIFLAWNRYL